MGKDRRQSRLPKPVRSSAPATWSMSSRQKRRDNSSCIRSRKSPAPWWSKTRGLAACLRWSAASPLTRASSTARRRRLRATRLIVQAFRLRRRARQRLHAFDDRSRCPGRDRSRTWRRRLATRELRGQVLPVRPRCVSALEHSRNVMTVRLAQDIGMPLIAEYAKRFGVYDDLPPYLSFALAARARRRCCA